MSTRVIDLPNRLKVKRRNVSCLRARGRVISRVDCTEFRDVSTSASSVLQIMTRSAEDTNHVAITRDWSTSSNNTEKWNEYRRSPTAITEYVPSYASRSLKLSSAPSPTVSERGRTNSQGAANLRNMRLWNNRIKINTINETMTPCVTRPLLTHTFAFYVHAYDHSDAVERLTMQSTLTKRFRRPKSRRRAYKYKNAKNVEGGNFKNIIRNENINDA